MPGAQLSRTPVRRSEGACLDNRLGLLDELRRTRSTISIVTTYSVNFHFYETVVLRKLNAAGCEHHLLLVDAERCGEALADPELRPRLAGLSYNLVPVARRGAFHPKLMVLAGKKTSRVYIGSHNLTFAGFGGNAEITNSLSGVKTSVEAAVVRDALDAIADWLSETPNKPASEILALARTLVGSAAKAPAEAVLLHTGGGRPALWEQLRPRLPKNPQRVVLVGPFFDDRLRFVAQAKVELDASTFVVAIDPSYAVVTRTAAQEAGVRFVDARGVMGSVGYSESAQLHAKMIFVEGDGERLLVSGSANPSAAAWLQPDTNAEAVLVRTDVGDEELERLGIPQLIVAPEITETQWAEIDVRVRSDRDEADGAGHAAAAILATEEAGVITIHGVPERPLGVRLFFVNGQHHEEGVVTYEAATLVVTGGPLDLAGCNVVELIGGAGGVAAVNHSNSLSVHTGGGNTRAELGAALGALTDDPGRIEEILKIVERAIYDDEAPPPPGVRPHTQSNDETEAGGALGSREMKLEDVRRRHGRPRSLAAGNIAIVIDLLIRRIGEALPIGAEARPPEVEESELDPLDEAARVAPLDVDGNALLKVCHRKVRRLLRRMVDRLEHVMEHRAGAIHATVQLAAVLGVLGWLRRVEPQLAWLPLGESLIPENARDELFWAGAAHMALSRPSLVDLVNDEAPDGCEEVAVSLGLLGWLGRESGVDVRNLRKHPDEDDLPWFHWVGVLIGLLGKVVEDDIATAAFEDAIRQSRGAGREEWLMVHRRLATVAALAASDPATAPVLARPVQRGDLVRITMRSGAASIGFVADLDDTKVWVPDPEREDGRPILKTFVAPIDVDALASE